MLTPHTQMLCESGKCVCVCVWEWREGAEYVWVNLVSSRSVVRVHSLTSWSKNKFGARIKNSTLPVFPWLWHFSHSGLTFNFQHWGPKAFSETLQGGPSSHIWECCGVDAPHTSSLNQCLVRIGVHIPQFPCFWYWVTLRCVSYSEFQSLSIGLIASYSRLFLAW